MPESLPIQLAIRLLLDSVSYGNAMPEWFEPLMINYHERENRIHKAILAYLGGARPQRPFQISVPKRNNAANVWIVPSVNDQIIIQACVSAIAQKLEKTFVDRTRVFSSGLNRDPNYLAFLEDQVSAWALFQIASKSRCVEDGCVLQIDLKDAFESISIDHFLSFINSADLDATAVQLISIFLSEYGKYNTGLPFLNDSIFFLGNAYFTKVDKIIDKYTKNFVRYVDDYKLFGLSRSSLESIFMKIRDDLAKIGLQINDDKVWLGTTQEYLDAASKLKFAQTEETTYVEASTQPNVFRSADMLDQVRLCLDSPMERLHQGFGRFQMASVRRMRVRGMYSDAKGLGASPADQFRELLSKNPNTVDRISDLIATYSKDTANTWRLMWLLYMAKDIVAGKIDDRVLREKLAGELFGVAKSENVPLGVRLWASEMKGYPESGKWKKEIEGLHALSYEDRGRYCYGA
jgi:hypothetical protein